MSKRVLQTGVLAILLSSMLCAQDIAGDWQGTLDVGAQKLRSVLHIAKAENGWNARFLERAGLEPQIYSGHDSRLVYRDDQRGWEFSYRNLDAWQTPTA
jgi:hypothetical protein